MKLTIGSAIVSFSIRGSKDRDLVVRLELRPFA